MRRTLLALFLCAGIAGPQTFNQSNFSNGVRLLVGTSVPASCGPNDMFLKTDATPPSNLYLCPAGTFIQATGTAGAPSGNAGGDLGGTYPNPSVAQVGGVAAASVAAGANIVSLRGACVNVGDPIFAGGSEPAERRCGRSAGGGRSRIC